MAKYELTAESKAFLDMVDEAKRTGQRKSYQELGVEGARNASVQSAKRFGGTFEFSGDIKDINVPVPHLQGGIQVRLYKPDCCQDNPPIFIYFHGGGGVLGSCDSSDTMCRSLSSQGKLIVANAEYRHAPEHPFPAYIHDATNVTKWIMENKVEIGAGEQSIVGVGGDSHGGNVATAVCHEVKGLDYQVLIYPIVDWAFTYPSHKEFAEGYLLESSSCEWFASHVCQKPGDRTDPLGSCIYRPDSSFVNQPPCLMVITECDVLRDEGLAYGKRLMAAGVQVETLFIKGTIHAYFTLAGFFKEACKSSYAKVAEFINAQTKATTQE